MLKQPVRILSTKKLQVNQRQFLLNAGLSVVDANFIETKNKKVSLDKVGENLIFTSTNAVLSVIEKSDSEKIKNRKCFCVGDKTKSLLEENGFIVEASADYASELVNILKSHNGKTFTFFSGNIRLGTLPDGLWENEIKFNEIEVYETILVPQQISSRPDGILFFSPSAVESYLQENEITNELCFCIGKTTAKALEDKTENIVIAAKPSVENVIIQCINHYKTLSK